MCAWAGHARGADTSRQHAGCAEQAIDPIDLDVDLERDELAALLDRALDLLPPQTRAVLIQKYVDESPLAAIGERLGLSANAVAVRLHRGRLAFRRLLATELRHEANAFGLLGEPALAWQPTTMWCPICGAQRLQAAYDEGYACYAIRCPACTGAGGQGVNLFCGQAPADPRGRFRATLVRSMAETNELYRETQRRGGDDCPECGARVQVRYSLPHGNPGPWGDPRGMSITCPHCGGGYCGSLRMLTQSLPEVRAFWKRHPRMHTLPYRDVELDGVAAVRITFESLGDPASIDVFTTSDTCEVLRIEQ